MASSSRTWRARSAVSGAAMVCVNSKRVTGRSIAARRSRTVSSILIGKQAHVVRIQGGRAGSEVEEVVERLSAHRCFAGSWFRARRSCAAQRASRHFGCFRGLTRAVIGCMHSNRLPGSNEAHWAQRWSSAPQRVAAAVEPDLVHVTRCRTVRSEPPARNPGMLMFFGPSCEIRRAPAGAPGSGAGRGADGRGARSRSLSW